MYIGVIFTLISLVMIIDEIGRFSGVGFDMLKHKEFENLVGLFSSVRRFSRVYQG